MPISSAGGFSTLTERFPWDTSFVARASFSIGTVMLLAMWKPIQVAAKTMISVTKTSDHEIERLDQVFLQRPGFISLDEGGQGVDLLGVVLGQKFARRHQDVADLRDVDRDAAPDEFARSHGPDVAEEFAEVGPLDRVGLEILVVLEGKVGIEVCEQLFLPEKNADFVEAVFGEFGPDEFFELRAGSRGRPGSGG